MPATVTDSVSEPSEIDQIATRYWEDVLRLSPTTATVYGDERYNDRLDDPGPAGRAEARKLMERVWREAAAVSPDGLPDEDRITRDILQVVAEAAIEADDLSFHELLAVDQINGPQTLLAQVAQFQPADTPERLDAWLARIRAYGATSTPTSTSWPTACGRAARPPGSSRTARSSSSAARRRSRSARPSCRRCRGWRTTPTASASATSSGRSSTRRTAGCWTR